MAEEELIRVLEASVYPGAKLESIKLVIGYCKAQNLDPILKPVHIVPMDVKTDKKDSKGDAIYEKRDVIMPGIGLYRTNAARTGDYAGMSEPMFGPSKKLTYQADKWEDGEHGRVKSKVAGECEYPEWCKVTVNRIVQGQVVGFTAAEFWKENYATAGKWSGEAPNAMWKKRPFGQLAKCAEAQALRKAFPEVGAMPTAEEMEGKDLDSATIDGTTGTVIPQIEQPQSKSKPPQPEQPKQEDTPTTESKYKGAPATDGMKRTVRAALTNAALSEVDMKARFGFGLEEMPRDAVNDTMEWIKNPVPAK